MKISMEILEAYSSMRCWCGDLPTKITRVGVGGGNDKITPYCDSHAPKAAYELNFDQIRYDFAGRKN